MNHRQTLQWIITAVVRLAAGALAAKLGRDAIGAEATWEALAEGLTAVSVAAVSLYSSIRGRKRLRDADPPAAT